MSQTAIDKLIEKYLANNPERKSAFKEIQREVQLELMIFKRNNRIKRFPKLAIDKSNFKKKNRRK